MRSSPVNLVFEVQTIPYHCCEPVTFKSLAIMLLKNDLFYKLFESISILHTDIKRKYTYLSILVFEFLLTIAACITNPL